MKELGFMSKSLTMKMQDPLLWKLLRVLKKWAKIMYLIIVSNIAQRPLAYNE